MKDQFSVGEVGTLVEQSLAVATGAETPMFDEAVARKFLETMAGLYDEPAKYVFEAAAIPADGGPVEAAHFHGGELPEALAWWRERNARRGVNAYVGAAKRDPERLDALRFKRSRDSDVTELGMIWADFDDAGAAEAAGWRLKDLSFMPHLVVYTGTVPHKRAQLWWLLDEDVTPDEGRNMMAALAKCLGGDKVQNPSRVMRLPGSVAWAKLKKPGRVDEVVTLKRFGVPERASSAVWGAIEALGGHRRGDEPESAPEPPVGASKATVPQERETQPTEHDGPCLGEAEKLLSYIDPDDLSYQEWLHVLMGLHAEFGEEALALADAWSSRGTKYEPDDVTKRWGGFEDDGVTFGTVCALARQGGADLSAIAREFRGAEALPQADLLGIIGTLGRVSQGATDTGDVEGFRHLASPFRLADARTLSPRPWLYGNRLIRGHVSLTVSPGGIGKSSLVLSEAVEMVTPWGREGASTVGGYRHLGRPLRVAYINGEDPLDEIERRVLAICKHYGITDEHLGDRLTLLGRDNAPKLAIEAGGKVSLNEVAVGNLIKFVSAHQIDVVMLDPLNTFHAVNENDNTAMGQVFSVLRRLADEGRCCVEIVHHSQKLARLTGSDIGIGQARGAGTLIDSARSARFLVAMTKSEASNAGLESGDGYFQVQNGKANLAPLSSAAKWFKMASVALENGDDEYPEGDHVGVPERWKWPDAFEGVTTDDAKRVQAVIASGRWRASAQATEWAGYAVGQVLGLDLGEGRKARDCTEDQKAARARVRSILSTWVENEVLVEVEGRDDNARRGTKYIEVPEEECPVDVSAAMDELATHEGGEA